MKGKQVKEPTQLAVKQPIVMAGLFLVSSLSVVSSTCQFQHGGCRPGNPQTLILITSDDQSIGAI